MGGAGGRSLVVEGGAVSRRNWVVRGVVLCDQASDYSMSYTLHVLLALFPRGLGMRLM